MANISFLVEEVFQITGLTALIPNQILQIHWFNPAIGPNQSCNVHDPLEKPPYS
jgi:hypothetical protein